MSPAIAIEFLLLSALWGASFLFMRIAVIEFGALPTAALRVAVAALVLFPLLWLRGLLPQLRQHWKKIFVVGALNSGIPFALFCFALLSISTGLSAILNATVPLFGALVAWFWLRDRPTPSRILGLAVGFAGVALLAWDKASFKPDASGIAPAWAVLACLAACLCYGIAASFTKRHLGGLPPLVTAGGSQIGATVVLALPALWLRPTAMPGLKAWMAVLAVGIVCTGVAYVIYFRLIEAVGPARALALPIVRRAIAGPAGALFLGEAVTGWMLLCAAVIVAGTALSTGLLTLPGRHRVRSA